MIRIIREGSEKHPWLLKIIMGIIAVTFVVGMGWFGYEAAQPTAVAKVGPYEISLDEYRRTYQNFARFYKEQLKQEDVKEDTLKRLAINSLVEAKVWHVLADQLELDLSPEELRDAIVAQKEFQREGTFDPQYYERLLTYNRLTPKKYEQQRTIELIRDKARLLVTDAVTLTPAELTEVKDLAARQAGEGQEPDEATIERIKFQFLLQKKQRALQAFQSAIRAQTEIDIREELL